MEQKNVYRVVRDHDGDRNYVVGEQRVGTHQHLGHLVPKSLEFVGPAPAEKAEGAPANKSEPAPSNKAKGAAPANKAATGRRAKKK